LGDVK